MKLAFKQMKPITKGITDGSVSEIHVPNPLQISCSAMYDTIIDILRFHHAEPFIHINDPDKVMHHLIERNQLHLQQAFNATFMTPEITGKGTKDILAGDFDPNIQENLPTVNHWIKHHLKQAAALDTVGIDLTVGKLKALLKKQSKATSSSPSGQHYSHYK
eukprot:3073684-Ditylum_brightwellii.AAC.1